MEELRERKEDRKNVCVRVRGCKSDRENGKSEKERM